MNRETQKAKAREFLESVDKLDFQTLRAAMAQGFVSSANGGDAMTVEQYEGMVRGITTAFSNGRHIIETQVVDGDLVATRMIWTAVHTGEFNGVAASNRPVRISGTSFDRFKDGKIVEHHAQFDAMGLMVQIGAMPMAA
jgi:predicted ester cyclase